MSNTTNQPTTENFCDDCYEMFTETDIESKNWGYHGTKILGAIGAITKDTKEVQVFEHLRCENGSCPDCVESCGDLWDCDRCADGVGCGNLCEKHR